MAASPDVEEHGLPSKLAEQWGRPASAPASDKTTTVQGVSYAGATAATYAEAWVLREEVTLCPSFANNTFDKETPYRATLGFRAIPAEEGGPAGWQKESVRAGLCSMARHGVTAVVVERSPKDTADLQAMVDDLLNEGGATAFSCVAVC